MAHTSAAASSSSVIPGSDGTCDDDPTPGNRSGRWVAAAPAAHSASRRAIPKQPSAPAVASASVCGTDSCTRPVRSSREANGAVGLPFVDDPLGQLVTDVADTAEPQPHLQCPRFSRVACARLALTSGPCTTTPCLRASATSDCGE